MRGSPYGKSNNGKQSQEWHHSNQIATIGLTICVKICIFPYIPRFAAPSWKWKNPVDEKCEKSVGRKSEGAKSVGENSVGEKSVGEKCMGENLWAKSLRVNSLWVKNIFVKNPWVKNMWATSLWVKSICVKSVWVKSQWVKSLRVQSLWLKSHWVKSPWAKSVWVKVYGWQVCGWNVYAWEKYGRKTVGLKACGWKIGVDGMLAFLPPFSGFLTKIRSLPFEACFCSCSSVHFPLSVVISPIPMHHVLVTILLGFAFVDVMSCEILSIHDKAALLRDSLPSSAL